MRAGIGEAFYADILEWRTSAEYSPAERVAIEYAERFALDHTGIEAELFERLHAHFTDAEILDLTFCIARFLGFGRMTEVLGVDVSCPVR